MATCCFIFRDSVRRGLHPGRVYLQIVSEDTRRSISRPYAIFPEEWEPDQHRLRTPAEIREALLHPQTLRARRMRELPDVSSQIWETWGPHAVNTDPATLEPYALTDARIKILAEYRAQMDRDLRRCGHIIRELNAADAFSLCRVVARFKELPDEGSVAEFVETLALQLEAEAAGRTARAYRSTSAKLKSYNGGRDLPLDMLTGPLIADFARTIKGEGRTPNTISFYMRTLRAIYNKAVSEGRIARAIISPFEGVYTGCAPTKKRALKARELALMSHFDPSTLLDVERRMREEEAARQAPAEQAAPAPVQTDKGPIDWAQMSEDLHAALALFLFCYHARGMCFVDMANLKKTDVQGDMIRYRRQKTEQLIELRVLPAMRRIIDYFAPTTAASPYVFPIITDLGKSTRLQYESGLRLQNLRLKRVAKIMHFEGQLSTHAARHSWATMAKNEGLPLAVISEGLGHTSQKTTQIYLASLEQSVLDRASMLVSEAIGANGEPPSKRKPGRPKKRLF